MLQDILYTLSKQLYVVANIHLTRNHTRIYQGLKHVSESITSLLIHIHSALRADAHF